MQNAIKSWLIFGLAKTTMTSNNQVVRNSEANIEQDRAIMTARMNNHKHVSLEDRNIVARSQNNTTQSKELQTFRTTTPIGG